MKKRYYYTTGIAGKYCFSSDQHARDSIKTHLVWIKVRVQVQLGLSLYLGVAERDPRSANP